jgi:transcriptional regulator with XRE-family HTH domain
LTITSKTKHFYTLSDMTTGKIIAQRREELSLSRSQLAKKTGSSHVMIGKYERDDAVPSLEVARKIAEALDVSLDYLAGKDSAKKLNGQNLQRLAELELLGNEKKQILYDLIDTYIRDAKVQLTYSN